MSGFGHQGLFDDELEARHNHIREQIKKETPFSERELALINEAFMTGRIYTTLGEKEKPAEIHEKLMRNCKRAIKRISKPKLLTGD